MVQCISFYEKKSQVVNTALIISDKATVSQPVAMIWKLIIKVEI